MKNVGLVHLLHHRASGEMRKYQCYAVELAQTFTPDINMESSGVNSGIMAAVSNGESIYCGEWGCAEGQV